MVNSPNVDPAFPVRFTGGDFHQWVHQGPDYGLDPVRRREDWRTSMRWFSTAFNTWVQRFKAVPDVDNRSLLDNTLIVWTNVFGMGSYHDFFELPVDGDASRKKWVLLGASSEYRIGLFDGKRFIPESPKVPGHRGKGFYAAQSFSDVPDGRRMFIGWWQTQTKGMAFNQSMTVPLELRLTQTGEGPRLTFTPAKELEVLRTRTHRFDPLPLGPGDKNPLDEIRAELIELRIEFEPGEAKEVVFNIRDVMVEYDAGKQELAVAGHRAPAPLRDGKQRLAIYCDRTGVEVFACDGLCYVPMPFNTRQENQRLFLEARGGKARVNALEVHELRSAWRRE